MVVMATCFGKSAKGPQRPGDPPPPDPPENAGPDVSDPGHAPRPDTESLHIQLHVVFLRKAQPGRYSSDHSHVSLDLLYHRIQPSAQHLLGETESEPLDRVEW